MSIICKVKEEMQPEAPVRWEVTLIATKVMSFILGDVMNKY